MIPINTNKITKTTSGYIVNDYVDYLTINTDKPFVFSNISNITTYSNKSKY